MLNLLIDGKRKNSMALDQLKSEGSDAQGDVALRRSVKLPPGGAPSTLMRSHGATKVMRKGTFLRNSRHKRVIFTSNAAKLIKPLKLRSRVSAEQGCGGW